MAEVSLINKEPGEPFVSIEAKPRAELNQSRLVLIVFPPAAVQEPEIQSDQNQSTEREG